MTNSESSEKGTAIFNGDLVGDVGIDHAYHSHHQKLPGSDEQNQGQCAQQRGILGAAAAPMGANHTADQHRWDEVSGFHGDFASFDEKSC
jgi:hypothetical protein